MTVGTIAQDRTVKLPMPDASGSALDAVDANEDGSAKLFGDLLAQMAGAEAGNAEDSKAELELPGNELELPSDEPAIGADVVIDAGAATTSSTLQALLANAVSSIVQEVKADVKHVADANANNSGDVLKLAQLIAQNAVSVQNTGVQHKGAQQGSGLPMPDDGEVNVLPGATASLDAWANGPHAVAAPTTGAQERRPMDLAVVGVATHFAPVLSGDGSPSPDEQAEGLPLPEQLKKDSIPAGSKGETTAAMTSTVILPSGSNGSGVGANLQGQTDRRGETASGAERIAEVPAEFASVETADTNVNTQTHQMPAIKQVADEVARAVEIRQPTPVHLLDGKPALSKLKVLHIQLQPETLGTVTVRMELRANALELHVDAARAETAELIQRDREVLSSILRAAVYSADDAQIKVTHADPSITATLPSNADSNLNSSQSGSQTAHDRSSQSQERGGRRDREAEREASQHEDPLHRRGEAAGVYL